MEIEIVKYNEKTYTVYNPGEILVDEKGYILDQLQKDMPKIGRYRGPYLLNKYGLTEFDYYIIVVLHGKIENIPKCEFEGCTNQKQFNRLLPTKKEPIFEIGCCKEHTRILTNRKSYRKLLEEGRPPILKALAVEMTDEIREHHRQAALNQVKAGKHPWQRENRSKKILDSQRILKERLLKNNIDVDYKNSVQTIDNIIAADRDVYKLRGNPTDICYLYITDLDSRDDIFKIGVTIDINTRRKVLYHGYRYIDTIVLFFSTRDIVADLEYAVKREFMQYISLGTESFPMDIKEKVLEFISQYIKNLS